jgi:hypothetical protein
VLAKTIFKAGFFAVEAGRRLEDLIDVAEHGVGCSLRDPKIVAVHIEIRDFIEGRLVLKQ